MSAKLSFDGMAAFRAELRRLPPELRDEARDIVQGHVDALEATIHATYTARARTGNLARGLQQDRQRAQFGASVRLRSRAQHAWLFEHGTKARKNRRDAKRGVMPAAHAMIPPAMQTRERIHADLVALLRRAGLRVSDGA